MGIVSAEWNGSSFSHKYNHGKSSIYSGRGIFRPDVEVVEKNSKSWFEIEFPVQAFA